MAHTVFVVNSMSRGLIHIGSGDRVPLCGSRLYSPELTDTAVRFKDGDLEEHWVSEVQGNKWVRVAEYDYCKRCISKIKNNKDGKY